MNAFLFDMDGTIFDTERISLECWEAAAKELGLPLCMTELIDEMYGLNRLTLADFFIQRFGSDFPYREFIDRRCAIMEERLACEVPKKPGVPSVFAAIRSRGCKLALVSSTLTESILRYLSLAGLDKVFDLVLGGDAVKHGKPHPDCYLLAAKTLGVSPCDCFVVEDSKNGILAGSRAGMRTILVPDRQIPDEETCLHSAYRFASLCELEAHLDTLLNREEKGEER